MLVFVVFLQGNSNGQLYHDDFHSFDYQNGDFILREYSFVDGKSLSSRLATVVSFFIGEACGLCGIKLDSLHT
jgi:hypothetical protein